MVEWALKIKYLSIYLGAELTSLVEKYYMLQEARVQIVKTKRNYKKTESFVMMKSTHIIMINYLVS